MARTFHFKDVIAIFLDLQPLWPYSVKKLDFSDLGCSSQHVISKTKSVTPHFFYISDITNSSTFNGKILRNKSMLENFRANVLKLTWRLIVTEFLLKLNSAKGGHKRHRDDHHKRGNEDFECPTPVMSDELPLTCTVTDHCGTYTCSAEFESEAVTLSLKFERSQEPLSAEIILKVPARNFEWKHTFKSGERIQVEGFPLSIQGIGSADIYLTLTMDKYMKGMSFQASFIGVLDVSNGFA